MNSPLPDDQRVVEFRQVLRRHGEVGVEDHQHVAARLGEALAHGVALALAGLLERLDVESADRPRSPRWISSQVPSVLLPSTKMISMSGQKLRQCAGPRPRCCRARCGRGSTTDDRRQLRRRLRQRPGDHVVAQAELADQRQRRDEAVDQPAEAEQPERRQHPPLALDHVEIGRDEADWRCPGSTASCAGRAACSAASLA